MSKKVLRISLSLGSVLILLLLFLKLRSAERRLSSLEKHERGDVVGMALSIAEQHPRQEIQQRVARLVLRTDPKSYRILALPPRAYDEQSKSVIHRLVMEKEPHPNYILLAGMIEDRAAIPRLRQLARTPFRNDVGRVIFPAWRASRSWTAHLALARMGDKQAIDYCIDRFENEKNEGLKVPDLLTDLDYIRHPATVEVIKRYLFIDRAFLSDVPNNGYPWAAYKLLSRSIEGWPDCQIGDECLSEARAWVRSQKHLKIKR